MFVQIIQGRVSDSAALRAQLDKWVAEVAPSAVGWLGSTSGVTEDGRAVAVVRFESEEAAQQNRDRPEQSAWWEETARLFTGEPEFHNSSSVEVDTPGDPSQAGFVQVMQGRSNDPEKARELMANDDTDWQAFRPEILGSVSVGHDGDAWTMVMYFTSEEAAREGEAKPMPAEMEQMMKEMDALTVGQPEFFDLKDPWMNAPS
jgi:quinol monooxygenase YgiN